MADYSFGGSDEENAELKKLEAEVVGRSYKMVRITVANKSCCLIRRTTQTVLTTGRNLYALQSP